MGAPVFESRAARNVSAEESFGLDLAQVPTVSVLCSRQRTRAATEDGTRSVPATLLSPRLRRQLVLVLEPSLLTALGRETPAARPRSVEARAGRPHRMHAPSSLLSKSHRKLRRFGHRQHLGCGNRRTLFLEQRGACERLLPLFEREVNLLKSPCRALRRRPAARRADRHPAACAKRTKMSGLVMPSEPSRNGPTDSDGNAEDWIRTALDLRGRNNRLLQRPETPV